MKLLACLMVVAGLAIGTGALFELSRNDSFAAPFLVGMLVAPAGFFFSAAGVSLWTRSNGARQAALLAALAVVVAVLTGAVTHVMGPPAVLIGMLPAIAALAWVRKTHQSADGLD